MTAALGVMSTTGGASAAVFGPSTPEGMVSALSGHSTFGLSDGMPGSLPGCLLCDSDVNFATYSNLDRSDWRNDINTLFGVPVASWTPLGSDPGAEGGDDGNAFNDRWVFFYEIENSNPLGGTNSPLENFNVTKTTDNGDPFENNAYANGGFGNAVDMSPRLNLAPDVPNDGQPSLVIDKTLLVGGDDFDPTALLFTDASGPNPIATASIRAGTAAYSGGLFQFSNLIAPGGFSDVLWLSSNAPFAGIIWAETESPGGFGAAGDVAGIRNVPEPAAALLLGAGLMGLGVLRRKRAA